MVVICHFVENVFERSTCSECVQQPDAISNRKSRERSVKLIPTPKNLAPASHVEDDTEDVDLRMPSAAEAEAWWLDAVWSRSSDAATASSSCEDTA